MKNIALAALVLSCLPALVRADGPASPPDASAGGLRFSIAVSKFENHAGYSGPFQLSDTWGAILTDSLQRSGHFIVLGEADMPGEAAMTEQDFAKSGRVAGGDKAPTTGNMTPAQLLVEGRDHQLPDHVQASTAASRSTASASAAATTGPRSTP